MAQSSFMGDLTIASGATLAAVIVLVTVIRTAFRRHKELEDI
jgi:hypothetical protein